jgi:tetratricopeptide (TPR) repeat protein
VREHRQVPGSHALSAGAPYDDFCRRCFGDGPLDSHRIAACSGVIDAARSPRHVEAAYATRGVAWGEAGDHEQALRDLGRAIELNPNVALYYLQRGRFHVGEDRHVRQLSDYERAAELDSRDTTALLSAAAVWFSRSVWTRAIQCLDRAIEIDPAHARAHYTRYLAYSRQGNAVRALRDLDRALELAPQESEFLLARAYLGFKARRFAQAVADFGSLIDLAPDGAAPWRYARGVARLRLGDLAGGRADIAEAKASEPGIAGAMAKEGIVP